MVAQQCLITIPFCKTSLQQNLHGLSVASGRICDLNLKPDAFMRTNQNRPGELVKMILVAECIEPYLHSAVDSRPGR